MRRMLVMAGALLLVATAADAQSARVRRVVNRRPPSDRVRLVVNGGGQIAPGSFGQQFTLTRNVEAAPVTTDLSLAAGGVFEAGVRLRVHRRLSIGVVGFVASGTASGTLDAKLPHPFYLDRPARRHWRPEWSDSQGTGRPRRAGGAAARQGAR